MMASADGASEALGALRGDGWEDLSGLGEEAAVSRGADAEEARLLVRKGALLFEFRAGELPPPGEKKPPRRGWLGAIKRSAPELAAAGLASGAVFLLLCWLFRLEELKLLRDYLRQKLAARRGGRRGGGPKPGAGAVSGIEDASL